MLIGIFYRKILVILISIKTQSPMRSVTHWACLILDDGENANFDTDDTVMSYNEVLMAGFLV